jgi:hypothetical protein
MMSTPFLLLAAGLAYAYYLTPGFARRRRLLILFGLLPSLAGLLAVTNTWSYPSVAGLAFLAVYFADSSPVSLAVPSLAERLRGVHPLLVEPIRLVLALIVALIVPGALGVEQDALVMLGVLEEVLRHHPVARGLGIARQRQILVDDLLRRAAHLALGAGTLEHTVDDVAVGLAPPAATRTVLFLRRSHSTCLGSSWASPRWGRRGTLPLRRSGARRAGPARSTFAMMRCPGLPQPRPGEYPRRPTRTLMDIPRLSGFSTFNRA